MAQLLSLLLLAVMIFAIVDAITTDSWRIRFMPKVAWVLLIVFLPLIGSKRSAAAEAVGFGDPRRSVRATSSTEDDLAAVEREIEFYEKQAQIRRLEAKLQERKEGPNA